MKKITILLIALMIIGVGFLSGCNEENTPKTGDTRIISIEPIGGKYNASLIYIQRYFEDESNWFDTTEIRYIKNDIEYSGIIKFDEDSTLKLVVKLTNSRNDCTIKITRKKL